MLILVFAIIVMVAGPFGVQYLRNPSENIITQSKLDAIHKIDEVLEELHTGMHVAIGAGLQEAIRSLLAALWSRFVSWLVAFFK